MLENSIGLARTKKAGLADLGTFVRRAPLKTPLKLVDAILPICYRPLVANDHT
jgi:hypothetical protein